MPNDSSGVYVEDRKMIYKGQVDHLVLPTAYSLKLRANPTPNVANIHVLIPLGVANTIIGFQGGSENQLIRILGDGIVIIQQGPFIKTNTGANKTLLADKVYSFHCVNNIWYESA